MQDHLVTECVRNNTDDLREMTCTKTVTLCFSFKSRLKGGRGDMKLKGVGG